MDNNIDNAGTQLIQHLRERLREARRKDAKKAYIAITIGASSILVGIVASYYAAVVGGTWQGPFTWIVGFCALLFVVNGLVITIPRDSESLVRRIRITDSEMGILAQLPEQTRSCLRERLATNRKLFIGDVLDVDDAQPFIVGEGEKALLGDHDTANTATTSNTQHQL